MLNSLLYFLAPLAMSVSDGQTPRRSDMQRKLKELLHSVEKAHKADIQTYTSGHLGPNRLTQKTLNCRPRKPVWNEPKCKDMGPSYSLERSKMEANVKKTIDTLHNFTIATKLQEPRIQEMPKSPSEEPLTTDLRGVLDMTEVAKLRNAKQESCAVPDVVEQGSGWFTHSLEAGLTWSEHLCQRKHFDEQVLRTKDLTTRKGLSGREAAKRHERRLQQVRIINTAECKLFPCSIINANNINGQIIRCLDKCGLFHFLSGLFPQLS